MKRNKWIALLALLSLWSNVLTAHTNTTIISRLKLSHPDLGYDGGASLHTAIENLYIKIGDNTNSRYNEYTGVANNTVTTIDHNFGVAFSELKVLLYTGTGTSKVRVSSPTGSGWTIAATSGFTTTKIDVTTPNTGGPTRDFSVVIVHGKGAETLSDLSDIDFSTPAQDGQALVYNGTSSKWLPGASGDSSLKCQSISTPTLSLKSGYIFLDDGNELQVATDLSLNLSTILGSSPANATAYYLYVDLDNSPAATTLSNGRQVRVLSTETNFSLQTTLPTAVLLSRYVPICEIKSATTGTAWSGTGSSFVTLATRRHSRPAVNVSPTVYELAKQTVGAVGSSGQVMAGHTLDVNSFPAYTTEVSFYNLTSASDGTANARTLTNNGTVPFTGTSILGTATSIATFNGTTQSLSSTAAFFNPGNGVSFSYGGWVKATDWTPTSIQCPFAQQQSTADRGFYICVQTDGSIQFSGTNTAGTADAVLNVANPGFTDGTWHHLVWAYDFSTTTLRAYVDGVQSASMTMANQRSVTSATFRIGAINGTAASFFAGSVEEAYFTTLNLNANDVRRLYAYRLDHNKAVTKENQSWFATAFDANENVVSEFGKDWLVSKNTNSAYVDFGLTSTQKVAVRMQNQSFSSTNITASTFTTGLLSASPSFPLSHGLGITPKDYFVLTESSSVSGQFDKRYDLCSASSTVISCDLSALTIDSSHRIEIVASAAPIAISVPAANATTSGIVTTTTQTFGGDKTIGGDLTVADPTASSTTVTIKPSTTSLNGAINFNDSSTNRFYINHINNATAGSQTMKLGSVAQGDALTIDAVGTGIKLPTSGGTAADLNAYEEFVHTSVFTLSGTAQVTGSINLRATKIGKVVTLCGPPIQLTGAAGAGSSISSNTVLPSRFRPTATYLIPGSRVLLTSVTQSANGMLVIDPSGTIQVQVNFANPSVNWGTSGANGFQNDWCVNYSVQ